MSFTNNNSYKEAMKAKNIKWSTEVIVYLFKVIKTLKKLREDENCNENALNWEKVS